MAGAPFGAIGSVIQAALIDFWVAWAKPALDVRGKIGSIEKGETKPRTLLKQPCLARALPKPG
jgi:hypothetical protein